MKKSMLLLTALLLAGCAVGPDYGTPKMQVAATGPFIGSTSPTVTTAKPENDWWHLYKDPVLDGLVTDALRANTDIRVAVAHLERARAALRGAQSDRLPSTSIDAGGNYSRVSAIDAIPGDNRKGWRVDGDLSVGYEVDLFGRVTREIEAAHGDVAAAAADADAVRVVVVADTTRAYVDAAAAAEKLAVAKRSVDLLGQSLDVTLKRQQVGRAAPLDVLRIQALRDAQAARVPEIEAERQAALFRLATLTGRAPAELPAIAAARATPPLVGQPIPVGDGASLLARRPDVRAAERRLAADTARIGIATADLYPRIVLGGSIGQSSAGFQDFFGGGPLHFLAGSLISWNFPNQSAARARIDETKADAKGALAAFDGTVLGALRETETALNAYAKALDQRSVITTERDHAEAAARIVRDRQKVGEVDFLAVLDAERTATDADASVAAADGKVADAQVELFRALGGGWQSSGATEVAATGTTNHAN